MVSSDRHHRVLIMLGTQGVEAGESDHCGCRRFPMKTPLN